MSLTDSSHIEPARRGRHGAHYWAKAEGNKLIPCGTFYPTTLDKRKCACGFVNYIFTEREKRVFKITEEEADRCIQCGRYLGEMETETIDITVKKKMIPEGA